MLSELLVVELASVLAGPSVGQFFAELGARVAKIERPHTGDVTRSWFRTGEDTSGSASYFDCCNFGKESVALDLRVDEEREAALMLIKRADILISSFGPGSAERLGLDRAAVRAMNPGIVHASVTGYGPESPRAGYDAVVQAESGFMALNGPKEGPGYKMPVALVDLMAAHHLKEGILVALLERACTGLGRDVHVSLFEAAVSALANQGTGYFATGIAPEPLGSRHPNIAPYGTVLELEDARILLAVGTDLQFERLCGILGQPDLASDDRFARNADRVRHCDALERELAGSAGGMKAEYLLPALHAASVPAGRVATVPEALQQGEEVVLLREGQPAGLRQWLADPVAARPALSAPPALGQHTGPVLRALTDLSEDIIRAIEHRNNA